MTDEEKIEKAKELLEDIPLYKLWPMVRYWLELQEFSSRIKAENPQVFRPLCDGLKEVFTDLYHRPERPTIK